MSGVFHQQCFFCSAISSKILSRELLRWLTSTLLAGTAGVATHEPVAPAIHLGNGQPRLMKTPANGFSIHWAYREYQVAWQNRSVSRRGELLWGRGDNR